MTARKSRAQSALEYMTTYGWAIIIIAIVLGILFQLGVFNAGGVAPKVHAGSCQVTRVATGSQVISSLSGTCSNGLPQFVAYIPAGSNVIVPEANQYAITGSITIAAWVDWLALPAINLAVVAPESSSATYPLLFLQGGTTYRFAVYNGIQMCGCSSTAPTIGKWVFLTGTYSQSTGTVVLYLNGTALSTTTYVNSPAQTQYGNGWAFGSFPTQNKYSTIALANVQMYNFSMPATDVKTLYQEGIGGDPIDINYLVGWWPLNGNANDYSGFGNTGTPYNGIVYNSTWYNNYKAPVIP